MIYYVIERALYLGGGGGGGGSEMVLVKSDLCFEHIFIQILKN